MDQDHPAIPRGVIPPVVTALGPDGELDVAAQEAVCERQIRAGAHALFVAGTTGEGAFLTPALLHDLVRTAVGFTAGQIPVLVGALSAGTPGVIEAARAAERDGADGIVATIPFYGPASPEEIVQHFRLVAAAVRVPLLAYSIPPMTHQPVPLSATEQLFADGTVAGLKDSGHDWDALAGAIDLGQRYSAAVYSGYEPLAGRAVARGAAGVVASIGNVDPEGVLRLWRAAGGDGAGSVEAAAAAQDHLTALLAGFDRYRVMGIGAHSALVAGIKAALQQLGGLPSRTVLGPLTTLPEHLLPAVREHLESVGLHPVG